MTGLAPVGFCPSCGARRWPDARFCGSCSLDIEEWERSYLAAEADVTAPGAVLAEPDEAAASRLEPAGIGRASDPAPGVDGQLGGLFRDAAPADETRLWRTRDEAPVVAPSWMPVDAELSRDGPGLPPDLPTIRPGTRRRGTPAFGVALGLVGVLVAGAAALGAFALLGGFASPSSSAIASPSAAVASARPTLGTVTPGGSNSAAGSPGASDAAPSVPGVESATPGATDGPPPPGASAAPVVPGWAPAGNLSRPRWAAVAATLLNGDVLVAGGTGGKTSSGAVSVAEVYHVATRQWEVVTPMNEPRSLAQAVTLANGLVLVAGGSHDGIPLASAELFDPQSGTWTATAPMSVPRTDFVAVRLADGRVMAIGGGTAKDAASVTTSVEIYDPNTRTWERTGNMAERRAYATAVVLGDGSVLVAGGRSTYHGSGGTVWATAERWDPNRGTWSPAGSMSVPRYFFAAAPLPDGSALVAGGWPDTGSSSATSSVDVYDLASSSWQAAGPMASRRAAFPMLALGDGRLLAVGGQTEGTDAPSTASAELFDPGSRTWSGAGSLASPVWYPAAGVVPDGRVVVAGGALTSDGGISTAEAEVFTPPTPMRR